MKTIFEITNEYDLFEPKFKVQCADDVILCLENQIDMADQNQQVINSEIKENYKNKLYAKIRNLFFFIFEQEELEFYDEDNRLLNELTLINQIFKNYFQQMQVYANEINYKEMEKLLEFLILHYGKNVNYIDSKRESLEYALKGYGCINNKEEDSFEAVDQLFSDKIYQMTGEKVEKQKKI